MTTETLNVKEGFYQKLDVLYRSKITGQMEIIEGITFCTELKTNNGYIWLYTLDEERTPRTVHYAINPKDIIEIRKNDDIINNEHKYNISQLSKDIKSKIVETNHGNKSLIDMAPTIKGYKTQDYLDQEECVKFFEYIMNMPKSTLNMYVAFHGKDAIHVIYSIFKENETL